MERPLVPLLAALIAGIGAAACLDILFPPWAYVPAAVLLGAGLFLNRQSVLVPALAVIAAIWGNQAILPFVHPTFPVHHIARSAGDIPLKVTGVLDRRPEMRERGARLYLAVERVENNGLGRKASGRLLVYVADGKVPMITGDRVSLVTRLYKPRNYGLPGEFDYRRYLAMRDIHCTGFVATVADLQLLQKEVAYPVQRMFDSSAVRLGSFIEQCVPSDTESGILKALLTGDRGGVSGEIEGLYARTGVNHILSISGFHIGIIALVLYQLLSLLARRSEFLLLYNLRRLLVLATLPVLFWYLLITGAAPATTRSVLMIAACFVGGLIAEREIDAVNLLALVALMILAVSPQVLFDLSFQLSFLAIWGILVLYPLLIHPFNGMKNGISFKLIQFVMVSVAAIAATMLPVAYHFYRVSPVGIVSNFVVIPLLGYGAVVTGFAALLIAQILPMPAMFLLKGASLLVSWSNMAISRLDRLPQMPRFTPSQLEVLLAVSLLVIVTLLRSPRMRLGFTVLFACLVFGERIKADSVPDSLRISFLSLGQAESTIVRFPDGSNMLVDGGGSFRDGGIDVGERLLAPALWSMGIDRIDRMVLSHAHPDHLQGLLFVASAFPVGEFWESGGEYHSGIYLELKKILAEKGVPIRLLNGSTRPFVTGGAVIEPLAPPGSLSGNAMASLEPDMNDESIVFRFVMGRFSMLFTGDIGFAAEARLLEKPDLIASTVLKVPHHGSRFSSSIPFLCAVSPRIALISAGYRNSFHLPAKETVADLERAGAVIYRTDMDGSIELMVNPGSGAVAVRKISYAAN